jgi:hypothetical protein
MPERKYQVGDHIVLQGGLNLIITRILPEGSKARGGKPAHYGVRKLQGTKDYVVDEATIAGLAHEVDSEAIKDEKREQKRDIGNDVGPAQAMALAEKYEGTPDGDRWLKLATVKPSDGVWQLVPLESIEEL